MKKLLVCVLATIMTVAFIVPTFGMSAFQDVYPSSNLTGGHIEPYECFHDIIPEFFEIIKEEYKCASPRTHLLITTKRCTRCYQIDHEIISTEHSFVPIDSHDSILKCTACGYIKYLPDTYTAVEEVWDRNDGTEEVELTSAFIPPYPPGGYGDLFDDTDDYIGATYADVPGAVPPLFKSWGRAEIDNDIVGLIPIP